MKVISTFCLQNAEIVNVKSGGIDNVAYWLKARTVKPAGTTVAREGLCKHIYCEAMAHTGHVVAIEAVFSVRSVPMLYKGVSFEPAE
jgi:hypothetical protein